MGEIPCSNEGDPLFLAPQYDMFWIEVARGGPGVVGVDMQVSDEFHAGDYSLSGNSCQPLTIHRGKYSVARSQKPE